MGGSRHTSSWAAWEVTHSHGAAGVVPGGPELSADDLYDAVDRALAYAEGTTCARCARPTGNHHQGHYWRLCRVTGTLRDFHFCCPDDCALEADR